MKNRIAWILALMMVLVCAAANAQEYVSVSEIYAQAQAMGGVWQQTFDTPNGELVVDVPISVPDVERMPVITVEQAKISEAFFNQLCQGKKRGNSDELQYEIDVDAEPVEFFLGREYDYILGEQTDNTGYDAVSTMWIYYGAFCSSEGTTLMPMARPITYHEIADVDMDKAYMRGSDLTVRGMMRLWQSDIERYVGEGYVLAPVRIEVKGSNVIENPGNNVVYERDGYTYVYADQLIGGIPVFGGISNLSSRTFNIAYEVSAQTNRIADSELLRGYRLGTESCQTSLVAICKDEANYRTETELLNTRSVEMEDVPLAPLERVLESIAAEIEAGHIREVVSVSLGYILYSNPDMTDYAWAIPRWTVDCVYVADNMKSHYAYWEKMLSRSNPEYELVPTIEDPSVYVYTGEMSPHNSEYYTSLPIDAQSAEPIFITTGSVEQFRVPDLVTWDQI